MALVGYVRCSTDKQTIRQQIDLLKAIGCDHIYKDKAIRATAKKRPGLVAVRNNLKPGDTFCVVAIDRAFRSTFEALSFLDEITRDKIAFRSLAEHIDTRTPEGRRWYVYASADAEYERAVISRRTRQAMAAMKRRGFKFGHPPKLSRKQISWARTALTGPKPKTKAEVARRLGVCTRTLSRALAA